MLTNPSTCGLGLPIHDKSCDDTHRFTINVANAPGNSMGSNVYLREIRFLIDHDWLADLDMTLFSPSGKAVTLLMDVGSGNQNFGNPTSGNCSAYTTLIAHVMDNGCNAQSIKTASHPYLGQYLPEGNFSSFNDGSNPNGHWVLEICDDEATGYGTLEFVELVFAPATACLQPSSVKVVAVDSNTVQLDWVPGSNDCSNTIIEYGPLGFVPGTGALGGSGSLGILSWGCPPATLTGLVPSTGYDVYIRQNCGGANFSQNSCISSFSTSCSPAPATLFEDFDSQNLCTTLCGVPCPITGIWRNSLNDGFDWTVNQDSTSTGKTGPLTDVSGTGRYIYLETSGTGCRSANVALLTSACIEVVARPDTCDMSFYYSMYGQNVQRLRLQASVDGGDNWLTLWQNTGDKGPGWHRAYVDLDVLDGQVVQFRFVGQGGNGPRGDMALDEIVFHGSQLSNEPAYFYFADNDGDGYGTPGIYYSTCAPYQLPGYVPDSTDCNDELPFINPGMPESPCDNFDLNCNGMVDEYDLPPPAVMGDTVCSGTVGSVSATKSQSNGTIRWYASPTGQSALATGASYTPPNFPENLTSSPLTLTYYAEETSPDSCRSTSRSAVNIVILPQAQINTTDSPEVCAGSPYDLTTINVIDANGSNGVISYHSGFPSNAGNEISPVVFPMESDVFYIASTPAGGCTDVASVQFTILESPSASIQGDDFLCYGGNGKALAVNDLGNGLPPLDYNWNTGDSLALVNISPNPIKFGTDIYSVTITGSNGCSSIDSLTVTSLTSVDNVQVQVTSVSTCGGNDGSIMLNPLIGQAPFIYTWENGTEDEQMGSFTLTDLEQGTYSFTITDNSDEGCPAFVKNIVVDGPGAIVSSAVLTPVSCNGASDGCIEINVLGANPSILWSTGATTEQVCGLSANDYSVTITDGSCPNVYTYNLSQPDKMVVNPTVKHVKCFGGNGGSVVLNVFNGNPPYQYAWAHGPFTSELSNLTAGMYSVTVTDSRGCIVTIPNVMVNQPAPLSFQVTDLVQPACNGSQDGQITVVTDGGTPPYDVDWGIGAMGTTINSLAAGNYNIHIDDANGCVLTDVVSLPQPLPITVQILNTEAPECKGIDNGSISISPTGGNGGYSYLWNNGMTMEDPTDTLHPGDFWVTVTDVRGCTGVSDIANLAESPFLSLDVLASNPQCIGVNNGAILVGASGTSGPFQYNWSTNDSGVFIGDLSPGEYTVTVNDSYGCRFDSTITLVATQVLDVDWETFPPTCDGASNGFIQLFVAGGVQPYGLNWDNGSSGNPRQGLPDGNYAVTVTDNDGCKFFSPQIELYEPEPLGIDVLTVEMMSCAGANDGGIDVIVQGGTAPVSIAWSNGESSPSIAGLAAGNYTVTATDSKGCVTVSPALQIVSPAPLSAEQESFASDCVSPPDSVCLNVQGGVGPYQFAWSNGDASDCLFNVPVGDYSVTVSDAAGCSMVKESVKVTAQISAISVTNIPTGQDSICAGNAVGELQVAVSGGTFPYQYIWSNGTLGSSSDPVLALNGLLGGTYQVTITDNMGCTKVSALLSVAEADVVEILIPGSAIQHVKCNGGTNGAINLSVSGGFPPFQYFWENSDGQPVSNSEDLSSLPAGQYFVTVVDQQGCTDSHTTTILQPQQLLGISPAGPLQTNETCHGFENGSITVNPVGGTPPYSFNWSNGGASQIQTGLATGVYFVTITDKKGCQFLSNPIVIFGPESPMLLTDYLVTDVSCFGETDGEIEVQVTGGTPPYLFDWPPPTNNPVLSGIPAGFYDLKVWDANQCLLSEFFEVTQPAPLNLTAAVTPASSGEANGVIIPHAVGGTEPYLFELASGQTGDTISGLPAGWYNLLVTDANFCQKNQWVQVTNGLTQVIDGQQIESYSLFPNPTDGATQFRLTATEPIDLELFLFDVVGKVYFTRKLEKATEVSYTFDFSALPPGVYSLVGKTERGIVMVERVVVF